MKKQLLFTLVGLLLVLGVPALAIDDYALAYKKITELVTNSDVPASGDFLIRFDASVPGPVKIDATDLSDVMGISSTATELDERYFTMHMPDFGASDTVYFVSPVAGTLETMYTVIWAQALNGAPDISATVNSVSVSPLTFLIASGSAAGTVDTLTVTAGGTIGVGEVIAVSTDGAGDSTIDGMIVFVIGQ